MKKVAVLIREEGKFYEGLRSSLGLCLVNHQVSMFVLDHEIAMDEAARENMGFFVEMGGIPYTTVQANAQKYGFRHVSISQIPGVLMQCDIIIPF